MMVTSFSQCSYTEFTFHHLKEVLWQTVSVLLYQNSVKSLTLTVPLSLQNELFQFDLQLNLMESNSSAALLLRQPSLKAFIFLVLYNPICYVIFTESHMCNTYQFNRQHHWALLGCTTKRFCSVNESYIYVYFYIYNSTACTKQHTVPQSVHSDIPTHLPSPCTDVICLPSRKRSIFDRYGEGPRSITTSLSTRRFVGGFDVLFRSSFFLMMIHLSLLRSVNAACPAGDITITVYITRLIFLIITITLKSMYKLLFQYIQIHLTFITVTQKYNIQAQLSWIETYVGWKVRFKICKHEEVS